MNIWSAPGILSLPPIYTLVPLPTPKLSPLNLNRGDLGLTDTTDVLLPSFEYLKRSSSLEVLPSE